METGATTLAFTPVKQHETDLIGGVPSSGNGHNNMEINLDFPDVDAAYQVHKDLRTHMLMIIYACWNSTSGHSVPSLMAFQNKVMLVDNSFFVDDEVVLSEIYLPFDEFELLDEFE